jgi:hypothetical protein
MEENKMTTYNKTLVGALEELGIPLKQIAESLGGINGEQLAVYKNAVSAPQEELILCYTVGTLEFTTFKEKGQEVKYGLLDMGLYSLEGKLSGRYQVIWRPDPTIPPSQLFTIPAKEYMGPWDKVVEPMPPVFQMRANSEASYRFDGVGTIYATGPANLLLVPLTDGSQLFVVSVCSYVTGGSGSYVGCRGVNTALGSSFVPQGVNVLALPVGQKVPGVTVSTFRVVRQYNIGEIPKP